MIKAEQIPDKVVKAAVEAWEKDDQSLRPNAGTIAAAINAWPGAIHNGHWLLFPHTKLPLTEKLND